MMAWRWFDARSVSMASSHAPAKDGASRGVAAHSSRQHQSSSANTPSVSSPSRSTSGLECRVGTSLLYLDDTHMLTWNATVTDVVVVAEEGMGSRFKLALDATIFYPAGGGQPCDTGTIATKEGGRLQVRDVKKVGEVVWHEVEGDGAAGVPRANDEVQLQVDETTRMLHARLHSAGHLLDVAMIRAGFPHDVLVPTKGLHTPSQAYVEYKGKITPDEASSLPATLTSILAELVRSGGVVRAEEMSYDAANVACASMGGLPGYIEKGATPRIVTMVDDACPCGGTHVVDVRDIRGVSVTGVRVKKGVTRVSYELIDE